MPRLIVFVGMYLVICATCWAQVAPATAPASQPVRGARRGLGGGAPAPADRATPQPGPNSQIAHEQLLVKKTQGKIDIYFEGDSITRRWGTSDTLYAKYLANWKENFFGWNAADFGWGADRIENILWRLENGELDGVNPKIIVFQAGTNNISGPAGDEARVADMTRGLKACIDICRAKAPSAVIIITGIFPRGGTPNATIDKVNENLAKMADGKTIRFINVNDKLADKDGRLFDGMMNSDRLHPDTKGYQVWADALKPIFTEILGPPAKEDHAPPPTGDPSAAGGNNAPASRPS